MKRGIVIAVMLALIGFGVWAQDDTGADVWRLKSPTAEVYLRTITKISKTIDPQSEEAIPFFHNTISKMSSALFYLFPDPRQTQFDDLLDAYTAANIGRYDVIARGQWLQRMIAAWINEHPTDLSQTPTLEFEDFYITVIPRDFNGDGQNEYVLDASKGGRIDRKACDQPSEINTYYVVQQTPEGYRFVDTDLPWKGDAEYGRFSYGNGSMDEIDFRDLTGDGIPEWIVLVGGETYGGPGMGYVDGGGLIVLSWRDNRLVYVTPSVYDPNWNRNEMSLEFTSTESLCIAPYPQTVTWDFKNVDDDPALEIFQVERYVNNWDCKRTETKLFDWDEANQGYRYRKTDVVYDETSQNCAQMRAETLMWTGDYAAAIPVFEQALHLKTLDLNTGDTFNYARSLNQYLRARLALAYLMVGNSSLAQPLLDDLSKEVIEDKAIEGFINVLQKTGRTKSSALSLCSAAYNHFAPHEPTDDRIPDIRVGYTGDDLYYFSNPYQPENIGCNAPKMLANVLQTETIATQQSPIKFLTELGIGVDHFLETDLNNDGRSEWLVWPDVAGVEIFFAPEGDHYHISYPNVDQYQFADELRPWTLPGDAGSAFILIRPDYLYIPWNDAYNPFGGMGGGGPGCPKEYNYQTKHFAIWSLDGLELSETFAISACTQRVEDAFPAGEGSSLLHLLYPDCGDDSCSTSVVTERIFIWDELQKKYVDTYQVETAQKPTSTPYPTSTPELFPQYYSVSDAFDHRNFEAVAILADEPLTSDDQDTFNDQLGDHYLRAMALEALGRDDEALAEYVRIYEAAPESAWGMLAGLHLERVEGK